MKIISNWKLLSFIVILVIMAGTSVSGQVTVRTFLDANNNGTQDEGEGLVTGLQVTATDANGNEFPLLDDGNGTFFLPEELVTSRLRIKVDGYGGGLHQGVAGSTSVFFVENGAIVDVPVSPGPNVSIHNTRILIPCYDGGPAEGKETPAFVSFPYTVDGIAASKGGSAPDPRMDAMTKEIGSTWGVAYQYTKQRAFTSALLKRHVGLGPEGLAGLYMIDYSEGNPVVNNMNLQGIVPSVGPAIDLGSVQRENVTGDVNASMPFALTSQDNTATYDMDAFAKVGATGFGDIDLEEDERTLWLVNLNQRSLISMDVSNGNIVPGTQSVKHYPLSSMNGLPNLNYRFAMCLNAGGNLNGSGAEPFTDKNKVAWDKNKYSSGGTSSYIAFTVTNQLNAAEKTSEGQLYRTFRKGTFNYAIPVPVAETYKVTLHFAEPNNYGVGDRLFEIKAEGQTIQSAFDIVAKAGGNKKATTLVFDVPANDGVLNLEFIAKQGAAISEALVSGIEVVGQSIMESGVLRPWGLTFHQGKGYLGVIADGSKSKSREHLFGFILQFDPKNMGAGFTEVLAFPLAYPRERASNAHLTQPQPLRSAEWQAWVDEWQQTVILTKQEQLSTSGALLCAYPQPIISDINFTDDGGMTIGVMDRWAHQTGYRNYPSDVSDNTLIVAYAAGDLLRAFTSSGNIQLESNNFDNGQYFRKDDGPGFNGEFFYEDYFVSNSAHHGEISTGGNGILRGSNEVVNTVFNPINTGSSSTFQNDGVYTQGIQFYNTTNGSKERAYLFVDQFIQGKANGLGDMEFSSEFIGGEIGNYVWCDGNGNGIQDPEEFGIGGVMLTLHDKENSDSLVAMTTSSADGQFIFTDILPNHCYSIRIDLSKLEALGFSGLVPPPVQGTDTLLDSDGDPDMIPGFSVAMFCTGPIGQNDHSIDFAFLGPVANDCELLVCDDGTGDGMGPCGEFEYDSIRVCVLPAGSMNVVGIYAGLIGDSLVNEITTFPIRVCGPDSCVYARVSIPGDTMCFSISKVTLTVVDPDDAPMPIYTHLVCGGTSTVNLDSILDANGLAVSGVSFFTDEAKNNLIAQTMLYVPGTLPDTVYFNATLIDECTIMGSIIILPFSTSLIEAGNDTTVCGLVCVDLTNLGAAFNPNGSGATQAEWSVLSGTGTIEGGPRFGEARRYCITQADANAGQVVLQLQVLDDPCLTIADQVTIFIESAAPRIIHGNPDTIDCTHPFLEDQAANDTFPGCRIVFNCTDTLIGTVVDYDILLGDCIDIIKYIKRTHRFFYNKQEYFCMDTIAVESLPDSIYCPAERDTVYCDDGYLKDANGHPSPLETGSPFVIDSISPGVYDTIYLWPAPPSKCDLLVVYKDTEFTGECPQTIRRDWFIKNSCTGTYDSCVQWIMIYDTLGPYVTKLDSAKLFLPIVSASTHDCYADFYVPAIGFADTCSGVKMVKAIVHNYGTTVLTYNPATKCYESHQKFRIPVGEFDLFGGAFNFSYISYEAVDYCHNITKIDSLPIIAVDRVRPVAICDKGLNVTVSDSLIWVDAESFNEGSWDNCGISMLLARRSDWATACGVNLCDDIHLLDSTEHHDYLWCARLESDKHLNPVEAHYQKAIDWLCSDAQKCALPVLLGWFYDLVKYATLECVEHPYEVDAQYLDHILGGSSRFNSELDLLLQAVIPCVKSIEADSLEQALAIYFSNPANLELFFSLFEDYFDILLGGALLNESAIFDIGKQIGGGWSDAVPFCCEDACQDVTVEVLVMDYWCNWSKCWTTVRVEDKTPPEVVCELYDVTVSCNSYKTYYQSAVELALNGEFDSLQGVLGRYDKVAKDSYGNVAPKTSFTIYDLRCDSNLVTKDSLIYDEHLGYIWKKYSYYRAEYDLKTYERYNGQIADNCGLICIEEKPWVSLDHCGNGFIKRVFKFVGQCSDGPAGHVADTIIKHQTIWITNDCDISKAMFDVPKDTVVYSCGIEYAADGSGRVAGALSPEFVGEAKYVFDNDCRLVGIGYYDKVFKIVGGDEACYKVIRTWCFADWCGLDKPIEEAWWLDPRYEGKFIKCVQKIIVFDRDPPLCTIENLPSVIDAAGCFYDLNVSVFVEDECGLLDYSWKIINTKTNVTVASAYGELNSDQFDRFTVSVAGLGAGSYKLKVSVTDECQNESVCDGDFVIDANKKPTPVCITSLTAELTPMDTDSDGVNDTAMAVVWANEFNVSSQAACGSSDANLTFRIDNGDGAPALPPSSATSLTLGCDDQGVNEVRMYVIDESGTWDYCTVVLLVQNNAGGCEPLQGTTGRLSGEIVTEDGLKIDQVKVMVEGNSGVPLWETDLVNGDYEVNVKMGVEAIVKPRKTTDPINGVSTSDLILIQKHILGKTALNSIYKEKAADANNDGKISAIDLIDIRKLILGMTDHFPSSDSWRFYDKESGKSAYYIAEMLETMKVDFVGVKVGDVNGSTDPTRKANRSADKILFAVNRFLDEGQIHFTAGQNMELSGMQFTLEFDPSKLQINGIVTGLKSSFGSEHFNVTAQDKGWISISWNTTDGEHINWKAGDRLFTLLTDRPQEIDLSEILTISSKITAAEGYGSNGNTADLSLRFTENQNQIALLQNRPNPWNLETAVGFTVPESGNTILTVLDVHGKILKQIRGYTQKGYHEWKIKSADLPTSGVYFYELETNDQSSMRKMVLMP